MPKKIVIITSGQPSTNPRMVKEYSCFKKEGYIVKVLYSHWTKWAADADDIFFKNQDVTAADFILIGGSPYKTPLVYFVSRVLFKIKRSRFLVGLSKEAPLSRTTYFLRKGALRRKADLYIAHNLAALPAAVAAAKKFKSKVGFDAEDYHRGESANPASLDSILVKLSEDKYIPQCDYLTVASPLIGEAYKGLYPLSNITIINNVFSKSYLQQRRDKNGQSPLTLFWFSQTIGPHRGLETVVKAIEHLKGECSIELHLLGDVSSEYASQLLSYTSFRSIHFIEPVVPEKIFEIAAKFDIGLSVEVPHCENREFCLTNKLFTYLLAGNCVILSNTKAHEAFYHSYPQTGYIFDYKNVCHLADILLNLYLNEDKLQSAKESSSKLAEEVFNWEKESIKLQRLIISQLSE